jgi:5'-methylthioadenosine phosphorylase
MMGIEIGVIARVGAHDSMKEAGAEVVEARVKKTPFGPSNPVHLMDLDGSRFALISRHGEMGYRTAAPWVNDRANLWALKDLGVEKIVSFSSPGSLDESIHAGDLVVPHDVLDETRSPHYTFFEGRGVGVIRMCHPFCPELASSFAKTLKDKGFTTFAGGVYVGTQGPRLETPAEIRKLRAMGGTVVGMTVVPEVFLAKELEICYASVCLVVNQAEGIKDRPYEKGVLFEGLADPEEMEKVKRMESNAGLLLSALIRAADEHPRNCSCPHAMERYKIRGDLNPDWKKWWD